MFRWLLRKQKQEEEIGEELDYHLSMLARERIEAAFAARRNLGNKTQIQEETRSVWSHVWLESLWQDVRYTCRSFRRAPVFAAVAILSLAFGIGANTAMFSILYAWFIRPLPFPQPDRLALVVLGWHDKAKAPGISPGIFPFYRDLEAWKADAHTLESLGGAFWRHFILTGRGDAQEIGGTVVTAGFFKTLGVTPEVGRTFRGEDRNGGPVVVISDWLWRNRLGRSTAVLGEYVTLDSIPYRIVGVMPASFDFRLFEQPGGSRLWMLARPSDPGYGPNGAGNMAGIARLKPGVSAAAAQAELEAIQKHVDRQFPDNPKGFDVTLYPLNKDNALLIRTTLFTLAAAIFAVLLVACFNIAGLQAGRSLERQSELAVRMAIGSGRTRLMKQLLTESAFLSLVGASLGVALAYVLIRLFIARNPLETLPAVPIRLNLPVLSVTAGLGMLVTLAFGVAPAFRAMKIDIIRALRVGGATYSPDRRSGRFRDALVVVELAATVVLLVGTGLLVRTLIDLRSTPLGFDSRNVAVARIVLPLKENMSHESFQVFLNALIARTEGLPGVQAAAVSDLPPLGYGLLNGDFRLKTSGNTETAKLKADLRAVSPGYFQALSVPLLEGRAFGAQDSASAQPVAIVNKLFTQRWFPGKGAVGESVLVQGKWRTVIGVAANTKIMPYNTAAWQNVPQIYLPEMQTSGFGSNPVSRNVEISIRSERPVARAELQRLLAEINPNAAVAEFQPLTEIVTEATKQPNLRSILLGAFSAISLVLASIGIFGTLSEFVKQRRREIGIRSALGAAPSDLLRSVMLRGLLLASVGVILGAFLSLAASRVLASLLYGMKPVDPLAFLTAGFLLLFVAALASLIPARRAAALDPLTVLREE